MDDRLWMALGAMVFAAALGFSLFSVFVRRQLPERPWMLLLLLLGFAFQTVGLHLRGIEIRSCPIGNPFEVLQFISWSTIVVYLLTGTIFRTSLLGSFCATLAMALSILSFAVPAWDNPHPSGLFGGNPWIEAHASLAVFSYGVFGLLAVTGAMYLLQDYGLKRKRFTILFRLLPPLAQLDLVNLRLASVGVGVFSFSLVIGSVYWIGHWDAVALGKLVTTLLLWLGYLVLLFGRWLKWLRGTRFAWAAIILFVSALVVLWPVEEARTASLDPHVPSSLSR
jgi:HemX protein